MSWQEMYDLLLEYEVVSEETLSVVCGINGCNEQAMQDVLFVRTGWRNFEGWLEEMAEE